VNRLAKRLGCAVLLLVLSSEKPGAAELVPFTRNDSIGIVIKNIAFPATLSKDLSSGLTNKILIRVSLLRDSQATVERQVVIDIKYDLWEETFRMIVTTDGTASTTRGFSKMEDALATLANLQLDELFRRSEFQGDQRFVLKADVLFNPIDRERMEKIRKWVAKNSTYANTGHGGFGSVGPSVSPSAALFNRIFEQYASGAEIASVWREAVLSQPLSSKDLMRQ
jgi:hypothetical protein